METRHRVEKGSKTFEKGVPSALDTPDLVRLEEEAMTTEPATASSSTRAWPGRG